MKQLFVLFALLLVLFVIYNATIGGTDGIRDNIIQIGEKSRDELKGLNP